MDAEQRASDLKGEYVVRKYSDDVRNEAIRRVEQGELKNEVARLLNVPEKTVGGWTQHVVRRKVSKKPVRHSQEVRVDAIRRVQQGESKSAVARSLNISASTVVQWTSDIKSRRFISAEDKKKFTERVSKGENANAVARDLGLNVNAGAGLAKKIDTSTTPEQRKLIKQALSEGKPRNQIAIDLCLPRRTVNAIAGFKTNQKHYSEDQIRAAIQGIEKGETIKHVANLIGASRTTVDNWHKQAVAAGKAKLAPNFKAKQDDPECEWIVREYPQLAHWKVLCGEWIKGEIRNRGSVIIAITAFIERYLVNQRLPTHPADLLTRNNYALPDFYKVACPESISGIQLNNIIHRFLDWVLKTPDFSDDTSGEPITVPVFFNPVPELTYAGLPGRRVSSDKTVMPYWMIHDLRRRIASGPDFRDFEWVRSLMGRVQVEGSNASPDWFRVEEYQIDKLDPDCVWRLRHRQFNTPVLEMWSPVRCVAILVKLQTTARMGQIRMCDSGEADTFIYQNGKFVHNTGHLVQGTQRKPRQQGVFRRPESGHEDGVAQLYFNTNKTADVGKRGQEKGQECPWPHLLDQPDNPYYWLEKLRNWQQKYNPINSLTAWRELPTARSLTVKSDQQNAEYPDAAFLFRAPETQGETQLPISRGMITTTWKAILKDYQRILSEDGVTYPDGSPILLLDTETSNAEITLHGLRVSLITHMILDGGVMPELMMKIVGHARFIMTLYYTKPGLKLMQDALQGAAAKLDSIKDSTLMRDLAGLKAEQIRDFVVFNAEDWTTVLRSNPADRNPLGWLYMHDGICLAGGNTGPLDSDAAIPGCHNGGPSLQKGKGHGPVPGGIRNCTRCRWKCAGKHHAYGLSATLNNRQYHLYKQGEKAIAAERKRNEVLREKARTEEAGRPFTEMQDFKKAERIYEDAMSRMGELAMDIAAVNRTIERINALPDKSDGTLALALQGDLVTLHTVLEETDSELLVLAQICEDVEFFPDLEPGVAVFEFAQLLDQAFEREGHPMVFARMSENEKLCAANAFMRALEQHANPDNPLLARRQVVQILDRHESLENILGVSLKDLLSHDAQEKNGNFSSCLIHNKAGNDGH